MERLWVTDGGDGLQIWMAAANILNKQPRRFEKMVVFQLGGWTRG